MIKNIWNHFFAIIFTVIEFKKEPKSKRYTIRIPFLSCKQARSQDLERGGGYFERVRSVQTTLTRIFIDLESVSDGLSETWGEMSRKARKFKAFFRPKLGDLQKKKKKKRSSPKFRVIFRPKSEIQRFFLPKIRWSPKKKKKKKRSSPKLRLLFRPTSQIQTFEGGLFSNGGGLFSIFHIKSASKAQKACNFAHFTSQWGSSSPPAPPGYATGCKPWFWFDIYILGYTVFPVEEHCLWLYFLFFRLKC